MAWIPQYNLIILLPLVLQLAGLTFVVLIDPHLLRKHRNIMLINIVLMLSLIAQNYAGYLLDVDGTHPYARTVVGIYGYCVRPTIIVLFFYLVNPDRSYKLFWALLGVNYIVHLTALFSGVCFSIDASDTFHRGPLGYTCHIVSAIALVYLMVLSLRQFRRTPKFGMWIPFINAGIVVLLVLADSLVDYRAYPATYLTIAVVSSSVFYYIWLHLRFVWEHEQALLAEQRIQIMMSQIQPHFLYNTLSTIQALCRTDPEKASDITEKFGTYLRRNLASLSQTELVSIRKDLEHTQVYAEIEQVRFPDIHVEYDTEDLDFRLPALTIQPLVENAIRHGVRIREQGVVKVTTRRGEGYHEILIQDNGKGFDPALVTQSDESHIGIRNVRERLEQMCGGTLEIESVIGTGTTITIRIPE